MCFGEMRMEQISDLIRELTITSKTPNGISVYKKDDKKSSNIINDLTPTENIEIKSSYKTSKESKKKELF